MCKKQPQYRIQKINFGYALYVLQSYGWVIYDTYPYKGAAESAVITLLGKPEENYE